MGFSKLESTFNPLAMETRAFQNYQVIGSTQIALT
jgi:hypothetical protein